MNDSASDDDLRALFARDDSRVPEQPFVAAVARRVAAERRRVLLLRRGMQVAALAMLVAASPWLIRASAWSSERLDVLVAAVGDWFVTPLGSVCAGVAVIAFLLLRRLRIV